MKPQLLLLAPACSAQGRRAWEAVPRGWKHDGRALGTGKTDGAKGRVVYSKQTKSCAQLHNYPDSDEEDDIPDKE